MFFAFFVFFVFVVFFVFPLAAQRAPAQDNSADVKTLVFELANSMGMLRGLQQEDSILTLEHWAKGTLTVGPAEDSSCPNTG